MPRYLNIDWPFGSFVLVIIAGLILSLAQWLSTPIPQFALTEYAPVPSVNHQPLLQRTFLTPAGLTANVHAGTLVALPNGKLLAAWFGGTREGATDVAIYGACWDGITWSAPRILAARATSARELNRYLRRLGNPVLAVDIIGNVHLFYVITSLGGWSTSAIAHKLSQDGGQTFGPAQLLITHPWLNLSTLVRGRPLSNTDGGLALPVYHELWGKFGEMLRLDRHGQVLDKGRIGSGRMVIQPTVMATGPNSVLALLRRTGSALPQVFSAISHDSGVHWSLPISTNLPNPDASVAVLARPDGSALLVYNPLMQGRWQLNLARSKDGHIWEACYILESGQDPDEFSYPFLIRDAQGLYHLVYSWQRQRLVHVSFNDAWLDQLP